MSIIQKVTSLYSRLIGNRSGERVSRDEARMIRYAEARRLYDGVAVRRNPGTQAWEEKSLAVDHARTIVEIGADFLAGEPISFKVLGSNGEPDENLTEKANQIWERSGGESKFLAQVLDANIKGDAVLVLNETEDEGVVIRWLDPSVVFPSFDPHDCDRLLGMVVAYEMEDETGQKILYSQVWKDGSVTKMEGEKVVDSSTLNLDLYGGAVPAIWVRNLGLPGEHFGRSDILFVKDLVERYDHQSSKDLDILDYYAAPHMVFSKVKKKDLENTRVGARTAFFLPEGADVSFLEWAGSPPAVKDGLERMRQDLSEMTQIPAIAFGRVDAGISDVSGVALRIMYAPLLAKTRRKRASWGPALEKIMAFALSADRGSRLDPVLVEVVWQDPLPTNVKEDWEVASIQKETGVSEKQVLRERGYKDSVIESMEKEKEEESERDALAQVKAFDRGGALGQPVTKDPEDGEK